MRRALVTGGSGGIGAAIARRLAHDGIEVIVHAHRNAAAAEAVAAQIVATGGHASALAFDVTDTGATRAMLEALVRIADEPSRAVLLLAYDCPYPDPLHALRPIPDAFAVALLLTADGAGRRLQASMGTGAPDAMADPGLDHLRRAIPAARLLPLLAAIARGGAQTAALEYLDATVLQVAAQA